MRAAGFDVDGGGWREGRKRRGGSWGGWTRCSAKKYSTRSAEEAEAGQRAGGGWMAGGAGEVGVPAMIVVVDRFIPAVFANTI